ncbi:hypothetical protein [Pseudomonas syringae]|uniref:hypothetical protein n=1 Tax=Pseudomonas syringae TaxID=317 RepID=UPI0006CB2BCA|nr:hypothetical protein [Pseudomonas syringae]ALE01111.1 hypothetical protein PSYRMG_25910 [Pseudomonas syringae UMAF0158]MCK9694765.1 hypothetical protein [Pseudomonas syringae pv. syringae]MCK9709727.1 hypothetical protein [Pseudomonas syringae pv. syringae]MCK9729955.1 hypothetical protein [Pseudomonas syringae pv. syringae]MCK9734955.1 hypothetical protein [Pseudomonas syringae pv. syringae]
MKLLIAKLIAFTATIGQLIAVLRTSHLAYSEGGGLALALGFFLMLADLALETFEALHDEYLTHQSFSKVLAL